MVSARPDPTRSNVTLVDENSADVSVNGGANIDVDDVELLLVNGLGGADNLTMQGIAANSTLFAHYSGGGRR